MILTDDEIDQLTDEERFERLRLRIAEMQNEDAKNPLPREQAVSGRTTDDWLDQAFGIFAGSPEFERAVQYGREWRFAGIPPEGKE